MLNESTAYLAIECVLLHTGQILVLEKGSNKRRRILLMQPGKEIQLGNPPTYDRQRAAVDEFRQSIYTPAIVVPACVTTTAGVNSSIKVTCSFSLSMIRS